MSAISLINSGVAWFVAAAVLAFLFSFQKALSGWIAGIGGAVGSLYTAAAGFTCADWRGWRERCAVAGKLRCANLSA